MKEEAREDIDGGAGTSRGLRTERDLLAATLPFAQESVATSWYHVGATFLSLAVALYCAGMLSWWPLRLASSILVALLMVRAFITYHDYMHGAILAHSRAAWVLFHVYAGLALTPPRAWKMTHNYHHGHVGQVSAASIGAFPIMTTRMWRKASFGERLRYRAERHPLTVLTGYLTIFLFSICLLPLIREPKRYWDSAVVMLTHGTVIALLWVFGGLDVVFFVILLPMVIASVLGSYLFFAQHSFKQMKIISPSAWSYSRAAMESSSYMKLNRVMRWFTGNIGYHHVHHLNVRIPFYRLPSAMAEIPELQTPITTSLARSDIADCFSCCLWDEERNRMVSYREAARLAHDDVASAAGR